MLFIASLNSGSNGNCYYIGNDTEAVLIDAGLSCREFEKRMKRLNLTIDKVKAVFISHEHTDHIYGLQGITKKFKIPVYITDKTYVESRLSLNTSLCCSFKTFETISVGNLQITAFPKPHDAVEPCSFIVSHQKVKVGVFTDTGAACRHTVEYFRQCTAAFLECNYDVQMLQQGRYPYHLKRRITGGKGHLSNDEALDLFCKYKTPALTHLFLSHLSQNNNSPALVEKLFAKRSLHVKVVIASRHKETEVYAINECPPPVPALQPVAKGKQLSFFFS